MSAPFTHTCGATVEITVCTAGWHYTVEFLSTDTQQTIRHCPQCQADLYAAYRDGALRDDESRPTRPDGHRGNA
ncbi:MAG: hypothetical protein PF501_07605 [Salinisphaera sp.]|jgi:hypothetical protein|nr:hypothetical protein [Salinisphaera sp.]